MPLVVVALLLCAVGCPSTNGAPPAGPSSPRPPASSSEAQTGLGTGVVVVHAQGGAERFRVEVAATPTQRERGLMFREQLDDDAGMLFLFERQQQLSFWMKNTYLPLDMLFIDEDLVVKGIVENAEPLTTTSRRIAGATRFVLELKGGTARRLGLAAGDRVAFEGIADQLWQKSVPTPEHP
jgi:hypothetical protein